MGISWVTFLGLTVYALEGWLIPPILSGILAWFPYRLRAFFATVEDWWTQE